MKTYHPESWSYQAREMSKRQMENIEFGYATIEQANKFFSKSYNFPEERVGE